MDSSGEENLVKTVTIMYIAFNIPFTLFSWCIIFTCIKYFNQFLVFKSKGKIYLHIFLFVLVLEPLIDIPQIVLANYNQSLLARHILTSIENSTLWFIVYALFGRQVVLASIFKIFYVPIVMTSHGKRAQILFPSAAMFIWFVCFEIPAYISTSEFLLYATYIYAAIYIVLFTTVVFMNRKIPTKLFTDYFSNIVNVVFCLIIAASWSSAETYFSKSIPINIVNSIITPMGLAILIHFTIMILFLRPCLAVWLKQKDYINAWEAYKSRYQIFTSSVNSQSFQIPSQTQSHDTQIQEMRPHQPIA